MMDRPPRADELNAEAKPARNRGAAPLKRGQKTPSVQERLFASLHCGRGCLMRGRFGLEGQFFFILSCTGSLGCTQHQQLPAACQLASRWSGRTPKCGRKDAWWSSVRTTGRGWSLIRLSVFLPWTSRSSSAMAALLSPKSLDFPSVCSQVLEGVDKLLNPGSPKHGTISRREYQYMFQ